jgi:F0F1-type ATP synthase membrane subunit b/b'
MEDLILGVALLLFLFAAYYKLRGNVSSFLSAKASEVSEQLQDLSSLLQEVRLLHQEVLRKMEGLSALEKSIADEAKKDVAMAITREENALHSLIERKKEMLKRQLFAVQQKSYNQLRSIVLQRSCELAERGLSLARPKEKDILVIEKSVSQIASLGGL